MHSLLTCIGYLDFKQVLLLLISWLVNVLDYIPADDFTYFQNNPKQEDECWGCWWWECLMFLRKILTTSVTHTHIHIHTYTHTHTTWQIRRNKYKHTHTCHAHGTGSLDGIHLSRIHLQNGIYLETKLQMNNSKTVLKTYIEIWRNVGLVLITIL